MCDSVCVIVCVIVCVCVLCVIVCDSVCVCVVCVDYGHGCDAVVPMAFLLLCAHFSPTAVAPVFIIFDFPRCMRWWAFLMA